MLVIFNFLFIIIPVIYILTGKNHALVATAILFLYILIARLADSDIGIINIILKSKFYLKTKNISQKNLTSYLYVLGAIFIVVNFFQKDIACFSLLLSLTYLAISVILIKFSKIILFNRSLDVILILTLALYPASQYLGYYFNLGDNVWRYSVLALPLINIFLRWPEEGFSVVFFTAFVAQFIKNSF